MQNKTVFLSFVFLIFKIFSIPFAIAGVPKDNADHLLFGGGFSLGTTLCELTVFKDINIDRAKEYRDKYMSEWDKEEALRDYQLVGTGLNLGTTLLIENNDSRYSICRELIIK